MPAKVDPNGTRGFIVPVGGAEDKQSGAVILRRFLEVSGGSEARIVVIPTASKQRDTGSRYERVFDELGAKSVRSLEYSNRNQTDRDDWLEALAEATGVFLTGGNQLRISTILGGTAVAKCIRGLNARGVAVGGTSAGAAILSEHMIAFGESGSTPRAGLVSLAPGFGLTNRVVIDQHFRQRDRLGRLLAALAYNPFAVGLGLDEDTAGFLDPDDVIHVVGAGAITVVDASALEHSSMGLARAGDAICLTGIRLHILTAGSTFDLHSRTARPPAGTVE
ncbi:MAG TPA: cyanophycinase [Nannocystaceae bacterium]|nr:cyanophycinase [Nannocystaceae bacterium]